MCNDALGLSGGCGKGNGRGGSGQRHKWRTASRSPTLSDCNVINNRGGGGPFPWPLQATTPHGRVPSLKYSAVVMAWNSSPSRRPTCRSRIRVERVAAPISCVSPDYYRFSCRNCRTILAIS